MKPNITYFIMSLVLALHVGTMDLCMADSSENKAKETGKQMWKTLKKDLQDVKTTFKEQGKKAGQGAKRNLKEAKQTLTPNKKKTDSSQTKGTQIDKPAITDP